MFLRRTLTFLLLLLGFTGLTLSLPGSAQGQESNSNRIRKMPDQQCGISGRVLYGDVFKSAEGVVVKLTNRYVPVDQTFTGSEGRFAFGPLLQQQFDVEVEVEGYKPARVSVDLRYTCQEKTVTVLLEPAVIVTIQQPTEPLVSARELQVPGSARKAFAKGVQELQEKERPDRSLEHFRKAIEIHADYNEAYIQLARALLALNQQAEAQQVLERATEVNKENARAFLLLGMTHCQQGHAAECLRALREAVRLDKESWLAQFELGRALLEYGLADQAQPHAQRAHELNPKARNVHLLLHNVCMELGDYQTALAEVSEFLELFPEDERAAALRERGDLLWQSLQAVAK